MNKASLSVLSALLAGASAPACATWPALPIPPGVRTEQVADSLRLNGRPVRILRFDTGLPLVQLQAFYRQALGERRIEGAVAGEWIVSRLEGGYLTTIRLRSGEAGTSATVAVTDLSEGHRLVRRAPAWPAPADSQLLSETESGEGSRRTRQVVFSNAHAVQTNLAFFDGALRDRGWKIIRLHGSAGQGSLLAEAAGAQAQVVARRQGHRCFVTLTTMGAP
jgi:hypothetical protein